jgi:hypothetical protein
MLPWVAAKRSDLFKFNKNIAQIVVSEVRYATVYGDRERKGHNFLEFTIRFKRINK